MKSALSKFYGQLTHLHRQMYAQKILQPVKLKKKVISVGNITFGGTGKTPFVKELVILLQELGKKPGIVVRSYKADAKASEKISDSSSPADFGDEALWYTRQLKVPVFSGPRKWESAKLADEDEAVDVIIVDDGFQHHKLVRDIDIILIDALAGVKSFTEKARDSMASLKSVQAVILTRTNLASSDGVCQIKTMIPPGPRVFFNRTEVLRLRDSQGNEISPSQKVGLVSGIAHPYSFQYLFEKTYPDVQVKTLVFPDHHLYSEADMRRIHNFKVQNALDQIIITEKDEVKLRGKGYAVLEIRSEFEKQAEWKGFLRELVG